jgi:6-phosphogluconolactonase
MSEPCDDFAVCGSATEVAAVAAASILDAAARAIGARGRFAIVLAGGRTPLAVYSRLAGAAADWARWHIYFGDERCLAADDPGRNSRAAALAWLDRVAIPAAQRHPIPAERGAVAAAAEYATLIGRCLPFDLVLLGVGEDGHTASLFPGRTVPESSLVIPVLDAPKPPAERVSLTPRALTAAATLLVLVTGADKAPALAAWRAGSDLPVARVAALGQARVLVDREVWEAAQGVGCASVSIPGADHGSGLP